jgi:hypothetical protein
MMWTAPHGPGRRQAVSTEAARLARERPEIQPGVDVLARTADGEWLPKITTTGIVPGWNFPVVWVQADHEPVPWPVEDIRLTGADGA